MKISKRFLACMLLGLACLTTGFTADKKVFLLGGQSNMVGIGNLMDMPAELKVEQPRVMICTAGTNQYSWITLKPGTGASTGTFGPEVTFGRDMSKAYPNETIYLIKVAWSGTSLAYDWRPPSAGGTLGSLYTKFITEVRNALTTMPGGSSSAVISGMCWMQGESDASNIYPASEYETNLTYLIKDLRTEFKVSQMPFVIALIDKTSTWQEYEVVRQAQIKVAQTLPQCAYFDTDPFPSDGSHYYAAGLIMMGEAFASSMLKLLGTTPTPSPAGLPGDVNNDQQITIIDALLVARYCAGLNPTGFNAANADFNRDGTIAITDALRIAQYAAGLIN